MDIKKTANLLLNFAIKRLAEIFGLFASKNSGVTRNVVIDKQGKIVFLTRLFDKDEYKQMIEVIKSLL